MASRQPQPWRWLAACLAVIALLYVGVAAGGSWTPKLGLDLEGGASAVLTPTGAGGKAVTSADLAQSVDIIRTRVDSIGVSDPQVSVVGSNIEVDIPGASDNKLIQLIGKTAQLYFRQVVAIEPVSAPAAAASGSATPAVTTSGTATPAVTGSSSATPAVTGSGSVTPAVTGTATDNAPATTSPTTTPAGTTSAPAALKPSPTSNGRALSQALLAAAAASATTTAATTTAPSTGSPTTTAAPAATATPATTPAVSGTPAAAVSGAAATGGAASGAPASTAPAAPCTTINTTQSTACATLDVTKEIAALGDCSPAQQGAAEALNLDSPTVPIAACDADGSQIYVLAPAYMSGREVSKASSQDDTTQGWLVQLSFNSKGTSDFGKLTTAVTSLTTPLNQVAVVLDGVVQSAPDIEQAIDGGTAQITGGTGGFTQAQTDALAQILNFGSLPITLKQQTVQNVSPTLGSDELRGGLIAGGIGLALVLLYSLLYYRGLGLVTIASLLVSGATTYASVTVLGGSIGYRLSLAGIAGFIVAVGITADSFVVYFERLRDEVREGRTLRSGAERAWVRARRTIISADTVSLMAAAILYWLSVGSVRGFAFTLGLSTITDLFVVFFFTKPLISLLARTNLYGGGGKFSGLGRQRVLGTRAATSAVSPTPKEA